MWCDTISSEVRAVNPAVWTGDVPICGYYTAVVACMDIVVWIAELEHGEGVHSYKKIE
jgi:hypothetical protein